MIKIGYFEGEAQGIVEYLERHTGYSYDWLLDIVSTPEKYKEINIKIKLEEEEVD